MPKLITVYFDRHNAETVINSQRSINPIEVGTYTRQYNILNNSGKNYRIYIIIRNLYQINL
jgi:hypothetical protein